MNILFVNACLRGSESRTLALCQSYLEHAKDALSATVSEVALAQINLVPFDAQLLEERQAKQYAGKLDDPLFAYAQQFMEADEVVIGAPCWDFMFPAKLKVYFEYVSVYGLTFRIGADHLPEGLCRAKRLIFITTSGGFIEGENLGYRYLCEMAHLFGIPETQYISAEGLDLSSVDIQAQLEKARSALAQIALPPLR